ncbi:MAG: NAD-dependent epimerase/dehydratase family protein, partial [Nitrososphaera sp.]
MNILVTGATGFIGSNLVKQLAKKSEYRISALAREQSDIPDIKNENVNIIRCDLFDRGRLKEATGNSDV